MSVERKQVSSVKVASLSLHFRRFPSKRKLNVGGIGRRSSSRRIVIISRNYYQQCVAALYTQQRLIYRVKLPPIAFNRGSVATAAVAPPSLPG